MLWRRDLVGLGVSSADILPQVPLIVGDPTNRGKVGQDRESEGNNS
jgi:hypothetical protein